MAILTKCPQCNTVFRVSAEQLRAAGGWVRCGRCATEFNAVAKLTDSKEDRAAAINLDNGPKPAQELKNLLSTEQRPDSIAARLNAGGWRTLQWSLGTLVLALLLGGQVLWTDRLALATDPATRPWILRFCDLAGCHIPSFQDLNAMNIGKRDVRTDPDRPGVLLVNAIVTNRAALAQGFPTVRLDLKDDSGVIIASRQFDPGQCFGPAAGDGNEMQPRVPYHIRMELLMPDQRAINFGFSFL